MARKARVEIEGGLYHVITRGNDRQDIFHSDEDYAKFLSLLLVQKEKLPFFLYAYCLMTNHVHLLIERKADSIGRIMHRVLTGYSQYYNRRYGKVGHLLQGRHKSILCQSDLYMGELVRYIHLNPVRARMAGKAEDYRYSSQREYLGLRPAGIVDVDPILRLFSAKKDAARGLFAQYVTAGISHGHREKFDLLEDGRFLGSEEFVDATIHRIGETLRPYRPSDAQRHNTPGEFDPQPLIAAVESITGVSSEVFCGPTKSATAIAARDLLIVAGRRLGATVRELAQITGLNSSNISRRHDAATRKSHAQHQLYDPTERVLEAYKLLQPQILQ